MTTEKDLLTEVSRLQAENEALRQAMADAPASPPRPSRVRAVVVWTLIVVGCLAASSAAVGIWARTTALDTETYVNTVAPLPQDPAVSAALAQLTVDSIFRDVDAATEVEALLPNELSFLAAPVGEAVRELSVEGASRIISTDAFAEVWGSLNRVAHAQAVAVLTGRGAVAITQEGTVVLDLTDAVSVVRTGLEEAGLGDVLPPPSEEGAVVVLFNDTQLGFLILTVDLLDLLYWALPIVTIVMLGAALLLSTDRRRTWLGIGIGLAIAMAGSLLFLELARGAVVEGIEDPVAQAAIASVWDQLFRNLINLQAGLLVLSLVIAVTAFLFGSHRWAASFRKGVGLRIDSLRSHDRAVAVQGDALGRFLNEHLAGVRLFGVAAAIIFMLWWPTLTMGIVLTAVIGLIVYLGLVEVARPHRPVASAADIEVIDLTESEESEAEEATAPQPS